MVNYNKIKEEQLAKDAEFESFGEENYKENKNNNNVIISTDPQCQYHEENETIYETPLKKCVFALPLSFYLDVHNLMINDSNRHTFSELCNFFKQKRFARRNGFICDDDANDLVTQMCFYLAGVIEYYIYINKYKGYSKNNLMLQIKQYRSNFKLDKNNDIWNHDLINTLDKIINYIENCCYKN